MVDKAKTNALSLSLSISVNNQVDKATITIADFIQTLLAQGVNRATVETMLLSDLTSDGRVFGEFFRGLGFTSKGTMSALADLAAEEVQGIGEDVKRMWIAVLVNTCPDCLPRHREVDTERNWRIRGKPRTGWSVCRRSCKCQLIIADKAKSEKSLEEPIRRKRKGG